MTTWMRLREAKAFWGVDELQAHLAAVEAELDAARAGEARAVEALDVFARAYRVSMLPFAPGIDEADGAHHWMPHGWPSVADFKLANSVLSDSSALAWLAKQRAEAAAEALEKLGPLGSSNQELFMVPWGEIRQRIQELEAGAEGAGATESKESV